MAFQAGKFAFRPDGAQQVSLGQVNPRMRMNAAPGHTNTPDHCPEGATQFRVTFAVHVVAVVNRNHCEALSGRLVLFELLTQG